MGPPAPGGVCGAGAGTGAARHPRRPAAAALPAHPAGAWLVLSFIHSKKKILKKIYLTWRKSKISILWFCPCYA